MHIRSLFLTKKAFQKPSFVPKTLAFAFMQHVKFNISTNAHIQSGICTDATNSVRHFHRCDTFNQAFAQNDATHQIWHLHRRDTLDLTFAQMQHIRSGICTDATLQVQHLHRFGTLHLEVAQMLLFWILGFRSWILDFRFCILDYFFGIWILDLDV